MVVLAVLSGIAIPRYFDYRDRAMDAADEAAIGGIETMFAEAYTRHRALESPISERITSLSQIAGYMETNELPAGLSLDGAQLVDQRGYRYELTPETAGDPARLTLVAGGGPDDPDAGGGADPGDSGGGGS